MDKNKILSHPIRIIWAGWETDTLRLQENGWQLSAQENMHNRSMSIALKHSKCKVKGITSESNFDYFNFDSHYLRNIVLKARLASDFMGVIRNIDQKTAFNPIDAYPSFVETKRNYLEDFAHFRKINTNAEEIFLKKASMSEILQMALEKQEPNQEKIRKQLLYREEMQEIQRDSKTQAVLRLVS